MNAVDRRIIDLYMNELASDTNFNELLTLLSEEKNIITTYLKKKYVELKSKGHLDEDLNRELYKDIKTRGRDAFNILIQCLYKVHPHLAELLKPDQRVIHPPQEEEKDLDTNEIEHPEYKGICTLYKGNQEECVSASVRKLCLLIKAELIEEDIGTRETPDFHLAIKTDGKLEEKDIRDIESLYASHVELKIIVINIISEPTDTVEEAEKPSGHRPAALFIVSIHIHRGDHVPSVINIIKKVIEHNSGCEIRDIFRVVMEKLKKWHCSLNMESRGFPQFYFS